MIIQRHALWWSLVLAVIGTGLALQAAPAVAAVRTAVYTAQISQFTGQNQGIDGAGLFGPVGGNLRGKTVVARFTYDASLGTPFGVGPNSEGRASGLNAGQPSPVLAATLRINGFTWDALQGPIGLGDNGEIYTSSGGNTTHAFGRQLYPVTGIYTATLLMNGCCSQPMPARLDDPAALRSTGVTGGMNFNFFSYAANDYSYRTQLQFVGTGTYQVGGVPEPASWALLISGFALVGAAARRQRISRPA
jgi:hypothetical protein